MQRSKKVVLFFLMLGCWWLLSCHSQEEKDTTILNKFKEAIELKDTDLVSKYRKDVINMGTRAVPVLVRSLPASSGSFKSEIMYILEKLGDSAAVALAGILPQESREVQLEILHSLDALKNKKATPALVKFHDTIPPSDPFALSTGHTLAILGHESGFKTLNNLMVSGSRKQRYQIAIFYLDLVDEQSLPALLIELQKEPDRQIKSYVVEAIGKLKNKKTVALLKKHALKDKKSMLVRRAAAVAIFRITGERCQYLNENGKYAYPQL